MFSILIALIVAVERCGRSRASMRSRHSNIHVYREGRFRSCLTQTEDYVLACYRYIELNPVRANMVSHPRAYPWSSYRCNAEGKASDLIVPHDQYMQLDREDGNRRVAYRGLFKAHVDDIDNQIRTATNGNYVLGNQRFQEQIARVLGRRVTKGKAGRPKESEVLD